MFKNLVSLICLKLDTFLLPLASLFLFVSDKNVSECGFESYLCTDHPTETGTVILILCTVVKRQDNCLLALQQLFALHATV